MYDNQGSGIKVKERKEKKDKIPPTFIFLDFENPSNFNLYKQNGKEWKHLFPTENTPKSGAFSDYMEFITGENHVDIFGSESDWYYRLDLKNAVIQKCGWPKAFASYGIFDYVTKLNNELVQVKPDDECIEK